MNLLTRSQFLNYLRLEKRRADRSRSPLSLALFFLRDDGRHGEESLRELLTSLQQSTRETDMKGWVDHDVIGLLLPDTNEQGAQTCLEKVRNGNGDLAYTLSVGTYPDHLFERLLVEETGQPDLFPLDLDESRIPKASELALKRAMDVIGSLLALMIFSPVMLVTSLVVKWTSPGPVIFRQTRLGRRGSRFPFYKFRSMHVNTDDQIHREYVSSLIQGKLDEINQGDGEEPFYKMKADPRVTPVGRIIRKWSVDELPQFFNVLKGEMSLVGPRPPLAYEVEKYEPWHLRRILEVKPGITGLWQVDGRSKTSFDDMVRLDLRYALSWSLWLDVKILVKTLGAVVRSNGAV